MMRMMQSGMVLLLLAGCGHGEPFATIDPAPIEGPFSPATPLRLTYSPLPDVTPAWLPDGSGILYSATRGDRYNDRCLMVMPPGGGTALRAVCYEPFTRPPQDSLRIIAWPTMSPGGTLLYSSTTGRRTVGAIRVRQLKWGGIDEQPRDHSFLSAPTDLFGGRQLSGVAFLRWIDDQRFVYRADFQGLAGPDSVISGRFIVLGTFTAGGVTRAYLAGTDHASSVAVIPGDTLLFTRNNDSRLYALALATGAIDTLHDFGAVTRDVHAVGSDVVVITGGFTDYVWAQGFQDSVQIDRGGELVLLNRASGLVQQLTLNETYRHPVLSPDGTRIVAEQSGDLFILLKP